MVSGELLGVERAARKAALSRSRLETAIGAAHGDGFSLRAIAEKAGMSHEQVRRILERQKAQG